MPPKQYISDFLPNITENDWMQYAPEEDFSGDWESYNMSGEGILDLGDDEFMDMGGECLCCTYDDGTQCMGHKVYGGCECSYACPNCGGDVAL